MTYEEALQELDARLKRWLDEYPHTPDHYMVVEWWKKQAGRSLAIASELTKHYLANDFADLILYEDEYVVMERKNGRTFMTGKPFKETFFYKDVTK